MRGIRRKVAHVMGMPISLALRGLHVDDDHAESAWQDVLASLNEADRVFSTYRSDSAISRVRSVDPAKSRPTESRAGNSEPRARPTDSRNSSGSIKSSHRCPAPARPGKGLCRTAGVAAWHATIASKACR